LQRAIVEEILLFPVLCSQCRFGSVGCGRCSMPDIQPDYKRTAVYGGVNQAAEFSESRRQLPKVASKRQKNEASSQFGSTELKIQSIAQSPSPCCYS
jgi:hypothetical protein